MMYNPQLCSFKTPDNIFLPGLLYKPKQKTNKVALWLHGNGSSTIFFNPERMNTLAEELNNAGIAFFPFNNRGGLLIKHYSRKLSEIEEERVSYGMTYEIIKDCILDIDGAIEFLRTEGFNEFYLIGHSTGANKIVVYDYYKKCDSVAKYVLLAGGDDTGLYYEMLGKKKFSRALERSREEVKKGNSAKLAPKYVSPYTLLSFGSLFDTLNPDGDYNIFPFNEKINNLGLSKKQLFQEYKEIEIPTLVIYGALDEYCYGDVNTCVDILKQYQPPSKIVTYEIIPEADHSFSGKEKELGRAIVAWLKDDR